VLAYARTWPTQGELTWFGRAGVQIGSPPAPPGDYLSFTLSPDGRRVAISTIDPRTATPDVWVLDLARGSQERLTFDPAIDANAFWAPDSSRIVFRSNRSGQDRVYVKLVDANAPEELVDLRMRDDGVGSTIVTDYSRDAAHVLMSVFGSTTSFDIWSAGLAGQNEAVAVVRTPFNEHHAVLSPDGRWLAYVSNESGASQVYVQSFPDGGRRWQISSQGGSEPQWRGDGGELFFLSLDQTLMSVSISTRPGFTPGLPAPLFKRACASIGKPLSTAICRHRRWSALPGQYCPGQQSAARHSHDPRLASVVTVHAVIG
jgi:eukaryotic-like serine/threonine-protein kinase